MGERLANNAELIFQDCFIPEEDIVGKVNGSFDILAEFFPESNAYAGSAHLGLAVALYEKSVQWAKVRVQGGKPLIEHDGIRAQLSEMRMLLDVARSYMHRACGSPITASKAQTRPWEYIRRLWRRKLPGSLLPGVSKFTAVTAT